MADISKITLPSGNAYNIKDTEARTVATTAKNGAMSAADKIKLNNLSDAVENYELPTASDTTLGGVKVGQNLTMQDGTLNGTPDTVTTFAVQEAVLVIDDNGTDVPDTISTQAITVVPSTTSQVITPSAGYDYISRVTVSAIPFSKLSNDAGGVTLNIAPSTT